MSGRQKKELKTIITAGAIFFALLFFEHTNIIPKSVPYRRWIFFALFLVPYLMVGLPIVKKAVKGIGAKQVFDESFLMTLATIGAFAIGENAEACAVMLFYQIGEFFQRFAVGKSRGQIKQLMEIAPESAIVEGEGGKLETLDPDEVEVGSTLVIMPGEKIPIDGVVISGESMVDTAALTGESVPVSKRAGDDVISGCVNTDGTLRIKTTKLYEDSTVTRILELVENASAKKSRTENFITRFAKYYTPVVVIAALILAIVPPIFFGEWGKWMLRACSFLVISCPCALVISVPLSFFGGIGASSRMGVLVKGSNYLEQLSKVKTLVTDKTGTLTEGVFKVTKAVPAAGISEDELLKAAAAAEKYSTHPIAKSIIAAAGDIDEGYAISSVGVSGKGVVTKVEDGEIFAGNAALMKEHGININESCDDGTIVYVAKRADETDIVYMGYIVISDVVKEGAAGTVSELRDMGVETVMLTGDNEKSAKSVAKLLGINSYRAELLPTDKVGAIEEYLGKEGDGTVAFAGDGINDAPVLTRSDVGIAMGSMGSDAAIEAADIVIMDDDIKKIPKAVKIAKKTVSIAKQNIFFALFVKALILVLGALGYADMWAAVFADVGVAVIAILNAMRANKI